MEEVVKKLVIASFIYSIICPQIFIENILLFPEYKVVNKTKEILPAWKNSCWNSYSYRNMSMNE